MNADIKAVGWLPLIKGNSKRACKRGVSHKYVTYLYYDFYENISFHVVGRGKMSAFKMKKMTDLKFLLVLILLCPRTIFTDLICWKTSKMRLSF